MIKKPWQCSSYFHALKQRLLTNQRLNKLLLAKADFKDWGILCILLIQTIESSLKSVHLLSCSHLAPNNLTQATDFNSDSESDNFKSGFKETDNLNNGFKSDSDTEVTETVSSIATLAIYPHKWSFPMIYSSSSNKSLQLQDKSTPNLFRRLETIFKYWISLSSYPNTFTTNSTLIPSSLLSTTLP